MLTQAAYADTVAWSILDILWIVDDISEIELNTLRAIKEMPSSVMERLLDMEWIMDNVSNEENEAIWRLEHIKRYGGPDLAVRLMDMPFLRTIEQEDIYALDSLYSMMLDRIDRDILNILARPQLKDGITDDQTMMVAMLAPVIEYAPNRVDKLLDRNVTTVEQRIIELPLSGEVELAIVRPYRILGTRRSMDLLEYAVRETETLMDAQYSRNEVWLLFEHALRPGRGGQHLNTHITIRPQYDSDDASYAPHIIAHEVAHYYWRFNAKWIDEGMAEVMPLVIENKRTGSPVRARNAPCGTAENIMELEALAPEQGEPAFSCNYSLGEGLFLELLQRLGENAFWDGARKLYTDSQMRSVGIADVRQAFGPDADAIISRWYGE